MLINYSKINVVSYLGHWDSEVKTFWIVQFQTQKYEELARFCTLAYELMKKDHEVIFYLNTQAEYDNFMAIVQSLELGVVHHHG